MLELHESGDLRTTLYAMELTIFLYYIGNYTKAAEIGHLTIECLKSCGLGKDLVTAKMFVLVGKSKLLAWDISGLYYFDDAINLIEEMEYISNAAQEIAEACLFRMWRIDIKCMWKIFYVFLKSCAQLYEGSLNCIQKTTPPESISTTVTIYNQNNAVSVALGSQNLPVSNIVQRIQSLLNGLCAYGLVVGYCACIVFVPTIIFILTCWPCLICGCITCTSIPHYCCCYFYLHYVRSRTWIWICKWHCIVLLPLLIAPYYPIVLAAVLLVGDIFFLLVFYSLISFAILSTVYIIIKCPRIAYLFIKYPIVREYIVLKMFLYILFSDSDTI